MTEVVWIILRHNKRFLLVQRSSEDHTNPKWFFPGGEVNNQDVVDTTTAYQQLKEEVGLEGERFRSLFHIQKKQHRTHVFFCDKWRGEVRRTHNNVIGAKLFTLTEIHSLSDSLSTFINDNLSYLSYIMQHYDNHPDEWLEQWREV